MTDGSAWQITEMELARLGTEYIAYIRPVHIDNKMQFMLMPGDGSELCVTPNYQIAIVATLENDFESVSVH